MHSIIWKFTIEKSNKAEFERHYGPNGSWAMFFRRSPEYVGTLLLRESTNENVYFTIDTWQSEKDFEQFKQMYHDEYMELDKKMERLTVKEELLGRFESVG
ncbi:MAG: hypothetical protein HYZ33_01540 [Ignavibacteriales bacterium]|nr:hypothetical protein [Ignavibacteriales bacterium]